MGIVKGIMLAGDFTLNSANSRTKEVTFETDNQDWDGTVYLSAILVSGGVVSLVLGSDTGHPIPIDDSGNYGCINQKEHATWFIKEIPAGESVTLTFTTVVDVCHPDNYKLTDNVLYEVTDSTTAPYVNTKVDPSQSTN